MEVREPLLAYGRRKFTIEEYLEMEDAATEKHEYYQGEIFAMSGARKNHIYLTDNLLAGLMVKLKGRGCRPFGSDARIHIPRNTLFTYPDISIFCGEPESRNDDDLNFLNPTVIIEILSPSTRHYDRNGKFELYKDIASLKEYVLVDSEAVHVEIWRVTADGTWVVENCTGLGDSFRITSVDVLLEVAEVYEGVRF